MSKKELQKWESKLKFIMVMNGMEIEDIKRYATLYCDKCIEGSFSKPCPSIRIEWNIPNKRMEIKDNLSITFIEAMDFICMEWIKYV